MDILAARKSTGQLTGEVTVNGQHRQQDAFRAKSGYVPQARPCLLACVLRKSIRSISLVMTVVSAPSELP